VRIVPATPGDGDPPDPADPDDTNAEPERVRRGVVSLMTGTVMKFLGDNCPQMAAALSFYTFFSLPPLLLLLLIVMGTVLEPAEIQARIIGQIGDLIGPQGAEQVGGMLEHLREREGGGLLPTLLGAGLLLFGATGAFAQLQGALNTAWQVQQDPARGDIRNFLVKRIFSLAMVLAVAFLLLVSLALTAALAAFGGFVANFTPGAISAYVLWGVENLVALAVITGLFATMFKVLPDAEIAWHDVWIGAFVTTLWFLAGRFAIGLYLGSTDPGTAYGAAGSLAIVLIWVYYSSMVFLFGAEFTHVYATRRGGGVRPDRHAVRVVRETRAVDEHGQ
jgi:membrane protein